MAIDYKITEHIAELGDRSGGWKLELNKVSWSGISLRTYSPLQEHGTKIFYLICPGKRQRLSQTEWYMILCQAIS